MGIEVQTVRLLALCRDLGVDFGQTLTIGRQRLMLSEGQLAGALAERGITVSERDRASAAGVDDPYSDRLFELLGAVSVEALDYSDYEGASVIQDLNQPLGPGLGGRYSAVFDGGTLEHVFNLPEALKTYMSLPCVGGHLILALPANNEMGHGFYQFSPELFFRCFSPANGFEMTATFLVELFCRKDWLLVQDPAKHGVRVGYSGGALPTYLFVVARKTSAVAPFGSGLPLQSDYALDWQEAAERGRQRRGGAMRTDLRASLLRAAPEALLDRLRDWRARLAKPDGTSLRPFNPADASSETVRSFYS